MMSSCIVSAPAARAYVWPNKMLDDLEGFRWNQIGYHSSPFVEGEINPCDFYFVGPNYGGRSNVADWIRVVRKRAHSRPGCLRSG